MLTRSDVERCLSGHVALPPRGAAVVGAPPTVTRLELVTRAEAEVLLNASLAGTPGHGEDMPVWFVELQGTFSPAHISRPSGVQRDGTVCTVAMLVLDAETGEVVVRALRSEPPADPMK